MLAIARFPSDAIHRVVSIRVLGLTALFLSFLDVMGTGGSFFISFLCLGNGCLKST